MATTLKKTKILATVGPACSAPGKIKALIESGANAFRLNFSHGSHEQHAAAISTIRAVARRLSTHVAILADLQGPKIRTGLTVNDQPVTLKKGSTVTLSSTPVSCTDTEIYVNYRPLAREVEAGQNILLNDGAVRLAVVRSDIRSGKVVCRVLNSGVYSSRKGVNFPNVNLSVPALTAKDRKDLRFILTQDVDYIALSFVRRPEDLRLLRRSIVHSGHPARIIAKIEKPEALQHMAGILDACDGIMVARGDLGVEISPYDVPIIQKDFITAANRRGKLVIVATQMLESMISSPQPTRAESTDVANAILDGADAVMLSAETAKGAYPVEAVQTMSSIAAITENSRYYRTEFVDLDLEQRYPPHALCEAAGWASSDLGGAPVIVFTTSGATANYLAKIRNQSPIFAFAPCAMVADSLALAWNVFPFVMPLKAAQTTLIKQAERILLRQKLVSSGDLVVVVSGRTPVAGATDTLRIKRVGEI